MQNRKPTTAQVTLAFVVAIIADAIQLPLAAATFSLVGAPIAECFNITMSIVVIVLLSVLLGFHWTLLPFFILEVVPALNVLPTWTGYVAYVLWSGKKEAAQPLPPVHTIDVETVRTASGDNASPQAKIPPVAPTPAAPPDSRLQQLEALRQRDLITEAEYHAKRQQILSEI